MATKRREEMVGELYSLQERAWPLYTQGEYHTELARMFPRLAGRLGDECFDAWGALTTDELELLLSETRKMAACSAYPASEVT